MEKVVKIESVNCDLVSNGQYDISTAARKAGENSRCHHRLQPQLQEIPEPRQGDDGDGSQQGVGERHHLRRDRRRGWRVTV